MSNYKTDFEILVAPGLGSSGPIHWQTLWEKENPEFKRIEQNNWDAPVCSDWISRIEEVIEKDKVIIVAHSLACLALVHWAMKSSKPIKGALLVAPPDSEKEDFPKEAKGFSPIPLYKLPFKSIVVGSTNDPYISIERCSFLADSWGSKFINVGSKGHINSSSNLGSWKEGQKYLQDLINEVNLDVRSF